MDSALDVHRLHFAFTVTFHYLLRQLTMGLALLLVILKTIALRTGNEHQREGWRLRFESWPHLVDHWHAPRFRLFLLRLSYLRRKNHRERRWPRSWRLEVVSLTT
jgi:Cytochrome bd terminal oxidase subunit I